MPKKYIAIAQNEAGILAKNSDLTIITDGLMCCLGIVIRGPLGFSLMHFTQNTSPESILQIAKKLGPNATIKLYKMRYGEGDLEEQIENYLYSHGKLAQLIRPENQVSPAFILERDNTYGCGFLEANSFYESTPCKNSISMMAEGNSSDECNIDFGTHDFKIRNYKTILTRYLDPEKKLDIHVIYNDNSWQKAFELSTRVLQLAENFLNMANDNEQLEAEALKLFANDPQFTFLQDNICTYFFSCLKRQSYREEFAKQFQMVLIGLYDYMNDKQQTLRPCTSRSPRISI